MSVDLIQAGLMTLNAAAAIACAVGYWREWNRRERAESENAALRERLHSAASTIDEAAHELVALRKTNRALHDHAERMAARAKLLAVEVAIGDGTKKTCVWPGAKPEIWQD